MLPMSVCGLEQLAQGRALRYTCGREPVLVQEHCDKVGRYPELLCSKLIRSCGQRHQRLRCGRRWRRNVRDKRRLLTWRLRRRRRNELRGTDGLHLHNTKISIRQSRRTLETVLHVVEGGALEFAAEFAADFGSFSS